MTIQEFLSSTDLDDTLLLGYYGGGNFGDELLLEVLQMQLSSRGIKRASYLYTDPQLYSRYHDDFGYRGISRAALPWAMLNARSVVVGGGGLWGLDVNLNIFFLSALLFISRILFGKRIYLIGVGYYNSTNRLGRISAWFAAKASHFVIARDRETYDNFTAAGARTYLGEDIAFLIRDMDLSPYNHAAHDLERALSLRSRTTYITLRHFRADTGFGKLVKSTIQSHPDQKFIVSLLQPTSQYPAGNALLRDLSEKNANVNYFNADVNPLALVRFFQLNSRSLTFVTPQFHALVVAIIFGIPFAPIAYDNKVQQLLEQHGIDNITPLKQLDHPDLLNLRLSRRGA